MYIKCIPRLIPEIPREDVQINDNIEKEINPPDTFPMISFTILDTVFWVVDGKKSRSDWEISYSVNIMNSFIIDINKVINGIADINI